jgi:hypothetical protein
MRQKTVDYALTPDGNPVRLMKMRSECAALWGAIECVKNGADPGIPGEVSAEAAARV